MLSSMWAMACSTLPSNTLGAARRGSRGQLGRALRHRLAALALEGAGGHDLAAERGAELLEVDGVAVLAHDVYHVHGHDRGDAQLDAAGW